ncbi:MAG: replicative DNA helicase [Clostridia bacterium]|nr:replicative DNA helicase [Clostridia bacterium]
MAYEDIKFPYSLEAEQAVLGAIVVEPDLINEIALILRPDYFYIQEHAAIYEILLKMSDLNHPIDFVTLLEEVKAAGVYPDDEEAKEYLVNLAQTVPTSHNAKNYAQIVADDYYLRSLIIASRANIEDATERGSEVREVMDAAENRIYGIMNDRNRIRMTHIGDAMNASIKSMEDLANPEKRDEIMGVKTGFSSIDHYITGMRKSDLIFVAGRPGFGKTSLALNIATNVAKTGKGVAYFSLEMSAEQLATRVLASESMIDSRKIMRGELDDDDWVKLAQTYNSLSRAPIYFDDASNITITEMKAKLRRLMNKNIKLVIIDYLQLMSTGKRSDNRANEVQELTRNMKTMAGELGVAVMCCAQLNREAAKRSMSTKGETRPVLSDLRESGSVEQDADMVMLLYKKDDYADDSEDKDTVECIVAKNRHGETGIGKLRWIGKYTRFLSIDTQR